MLLVANAGTVGAGTGLEGPAAARVVLGDGTGIALCVAEPETTAWSITRDAVPEETATATAVSADEIVRPRNE